MNLEGYLLWWSAVSQQINNKCLGLYNLKLHTPTSQSLMYLSNNSNVSFDDWWALTLIKKKIAYGLVGCGFSVLREWSMQMLNLANSEKYSCVLQNNWHVKTSRWIDYLYKIYISNVQRISHFHILLLISSHKHTVILNNSTLYL